MQRKIFFLFMIFCEIQTHAQACKNLIFKTSESYLNRKQDSTAQIKALEVV